MSATGKAFHRSLIGGLQLEGRVLGDQPWAIRALLHARGQIEVIGDTVFERSRLRADRPFETIATVARSSAVGGVEMVEVAIASYRGRLRRGRCPGGRRGGTPHGRAGIP